MSQWKEILKQAERGLIELLSEESKNVAHSIETELESLLHANFPADLVTERNRLEKACEKTKQILEERRKLKWKKFTGINKNSRTRTLEYSNHFKFINFSDREKRKFMRSTNDSQPQVNQETEAVVTLEAADRSSCHPRRMITTCRRTALKVLYQRAFLAKMHIIATIYYWLITLLIPT